MTRQLEEPTGTISLVLTLSQIQFIKSQAAERGVSQAVIGREIVDRFITAAPKDQSVPAELTGTGVVLTQP